MSELFLTILNMSLTASVVIAVIMLARILLKRAPKAISYVLWIVAGFRLVFPFSYESVFSLIPFKAQLIPQTAALDKYVSFRSAADAAFHAIGDAANGGLGTITVYLGKSSDGYPIVTEAHRSQVWLMFGSYLWIIGMAILLIYSAVSIFLLYRRLSGAVLLRDNIYQAENLKTPFVLGLIRPKIYIPSGLSENEKSYIILHEQTHIKRLDHIVKLISFLILCLHWFNPLVWAAFIFMSTDMEMSCDEKVLKVMKEDIKKPYANTLLALAAGRHILNGSPIAFGEGNVKGRIKNVLNYKRPKFWIILCSIILVAAIGIGLTANPRSTAVWNGSIRWEASGDVPKPVRDYAEDYVREQIEYYNSLGYNITDAKISGMTCMNTGTASLTKSIELWLLEYRLLPEEPDKVVLAGGMRMEDGWLTEWGSTGQPYLLLLCDLAGSEKSWQRICVTNTDVITQDYGTHEMLERYGNEFTAAAMELYLKSLENARAE